MNLQKINKVLLITLFIILFNNINIISQSTSTQQSEKEIPEVPVLKWPIDKPKGLRNYAQELIFDKEKSEYYLNKAKAYYVAGCEGLERYVGASEFRKFKKIYGIKNYEEKPDKVDLYERDPYKVEVFTPSGLSAIYDFAEAEWYFTKAIKI